MIREARYGSADLGVAAALGNGLTYTGVLRGGGFEDQLYARGPVSAYSLGRHRAVLAPVRGGNATLAWEPAPGIVAYIGYSGASPGAAAAAALRGLALRARAVDTAQWEATRPRTVVVQDPLG